VAKKRARLRLVKTKPQADALGEFNLERFKSKHPPKPKPRPRYRRRPRIMERFFPLTHAWAHKLYNHQTGGAAWFLLVELDRLVHEPGGSNPVMLSTKILESTGLPARKASRALHQLEIAGAIEVERRRGRCPVVSLLYYETVKTA